MDRTETWNKQYSNGAWEILKSAQEKPRLEATRQFIYKYSHTGKILEIGCGEGMLQEFMGKDTYTFFTGIDLSLVAINNVQHLCNEKTQYLLADMETYIPIQSYDVIVFNESLYYAVNPLALLQHFRFYLKDNGYFISSIYDTANNQKVIGMICNNFTILETQITSNEAGRWYCVVFS